MTYNETAWATLAAAAPVVALAHALLIVPSAQGGRATARSHAKPSLVSVFLAVAEFRLQLYLVAVLFAGAFTGALAFWLSIIVLTSGRSIMPIWPASALVSLSMLLLLFAIAGQFWMFLQFEVKN